MHAGLKRDSLTYTETETQNKGSPLNCHRFERYVSRLRLSSDNSDAQSDNATNANW